MSLFPPRDRNWHPPALHEPYKSSRLRSPKRALLRFPTTLGEEVGPVFGHDILGPLDHDLITNFAAPGEMAVGPRIIVHGVLRDENARPVPGALIEVWQANAGGRYRHKKEGYLAPLDPNFGGCGRVITDAEGGYRFTTVQPGPYPWPNGPNDWRPAHIHFSVFGHAFAQRLISQMYFEGDPLIPLCPIVGSIPSAEAVDRLTARLDMGTTAPMDSLAYRFDITLRGPNQTHFEKPAGGRMTKLKESPSQTAGPYVHIGCVPNATGIAFNAGDLGAQLCGDGVQGERIMVTGRVIDGAGDALLDALVEIWQADSRGLFNAPGETRGTPDPAFSGFGRTAGDMDTGQFTFHTVKPGAVPGPGGQMQAPHITFWVVARGINIGLHTRMYFADEAQANASDPILTNIADQDRIPTLLAQPQGNGTYLFDIRLQGDGETIFFDI